MEEAYLRLEESNRRIQEQYGTLLRQYADLSRSLSNSGVTNRGAGQRNLDVATKPAASGESSVPDYPNLAEVLGLDEQDGGNARSVSLPRQPGSGGVTGAFDDAGPGDPSFPAPLPPDPAQGPPSGVARRAASAAERREVREPWVLRSGQIPRSPAARACRHGPHRGGRRRNRRPRQPIPAANPRFRR